MIRVVLPAHLRMLARLTGEVELPGEDLATRLMLLALQLLLELRYEVPAQDLAIAMDRLPAIPGEGFIIDRVRLP